jgi:hypothetical protein
LESYHPYLTPQKVSKNPQIYCVHSTLHKKTKSNFGCLRLLGVKYNIPIVNESILMVFGRYLKVF